MLIRNGDELDEDSDLDDESTNNNKKSATKSNGKVKQQQQQQTGSTSSDNMNMDDLDDLDDINDEELEGDAEEEEEQPDEDEVARLEDGCLEQDGAARFCLRPTRHGGQQPFLHVDNQECRLRCINQHRSVLLP